MLCNRLSWLYAVTESAQPIVKHYKDFTCKYILSKLKRNLSKRKVYLLMIHVLFVFLSFTQPSSVYLLSFPEKWWYRHAFFFSKVLFLSCTQYTKSTLPAPPGQQRQHKEVRVQHDACSSRFNFIPSRLTVKLKGVYHIMYVFEKQQQ